MDMTAHHLESNQKGTKTMLRKVILVISISMTVIIMAFYIYAELTVQDRFRSTRQAIRDYKETQTTEATRVVEDRERQTGTAD